MHRLLLALFLPAALFGCQGPEATQQAVAAPAERAAPTDPHSHAQPNEARIDHLDLRLAADFERQVLSGSARYRITAATDADTLTLDSKGLIIERVTIGEAEREATFELSDADPILGSALRIPIQPETQLVTVYYRTTPEGADAVDWLAPAQTLDKQQPFLFTQGQAILTRTWIPIQDSPGIRITYDAEITVPKGLLAVMSAENPQQLNDSGVYTFRMRQPIPPYLIALAAGDLRFRALSDRTGVYAEPGMIDRAANELVDMEKMMQAAEALYGPYAWERYDVIVLPPSFPFGGMENPRLTFATPTIIAGDRSLVSLIAHELAHSWSGNLVTNATWDDFWLNEGFTTYFENRIMEVLYGADYARMLAQLGYQDLQADVEDLGPESADTRLKIDLTGRDPDEGMTDIAYEKGSHFLRLLEQKAGREQFDQFLRRYFDEHRFQTLTTEEFVPYLRRNLIDKYNLDVNIDEWIYEPGLPENIPRAASARFDSVDQALQTLAQGTSAAELPWAEWSTHERLHFVRHLPADLPEARMRNLDQTFGLTKSGNSEIQAAWYELTIRNGYARSILPDIEQFLVEVGRRKFLTPLYGAMMENGMANEARRIFARAAPGYHSVSRNSVEALIEEG